MEVIEYNLTTFDSSDGVRPFARPVWNPLDFVDDDEVEKYIELDEDYLVELDSRIPEVCETYGVPVVNPPSKVVGYEVGDDRVDLSLSTVVLARQLVWQEEIFGMRTSIEDTFISKNSWNFCEVTSSIPASRSSSYEYAVKNGTFSRLGFVDVPVLRLVGNVQKGDRSHSSSAVGKAGMLGRRLLSLRPAARTVFHFANLIQDACLNVARIKDPKYLHQVLGGCGVPPLFDDPVNTYLYVRAYKGGERSRIFGTAINEARRAVLSLDDGKPARLVLCQRLREKEEYLHATYGSSVLLTSGGGIRSPSGGTVQPLYTAAGTSGVVQGAERRLLQLRKVIPRRQALVEVSRTTRLQSTIFGAIVVPEAERLQRLEKKARNREV